MLHQKNIGIGYSKENNECLESEQLVTKDHALKVLEESRCVITKLNVNDIEVMELYQEVIAERRVNRFRKKCSF